MIIKSQSEELDVHLYIRDEWSLALVGEGLDERGRAALEFVKKHAKNVVAYKYDPEKRLHIVNGDRMAPPMFSKFFKSHERVLLEGTTLGVAEIALSARYLREHGVCFDVLYIEPLDYKRPPSSRILGTREFSLTDRWDNYIGIPGFTLDFSQEPQGVFVCFLGYEGQRLTTALIDKVPDHDGWKKIAIFGVPGFGAGWDINSLANNVEQIHQNSFLSIKFCSASSVREGYRVLQEILKQNPNTEIPIIIAPFGTKPHSIATALFLCENSAYDRVRLLFDHPIRSSDRSSQIKKWHLYTVEGE